MFRPAPLPGVRARTLPPASVLSHDDVGWLKTVDELYYGLNNHIQRAQVKNLVSSVIESLLANPDRKFIIVEQAFFQMWWDEQEQDMQDTTRQLVASGQLEFINGGWASKYKGPILNHSTFLCKCASAPPPPSFDQSHSQCEFVDPQALIPKYNLRRARALPCVGTTKRTTRTPSS